MTLRDWDHDGYSKGPDSLSRNGVKSSNTNPENKAAGILLLCTKGNSFDMKNLKMQ